MNEIFICEGLDISKFDDTRNEKQEAAEKQFLGTKIDYDDDHEQFMTKFSEINGLEAAVLLQNQATVHDFTGADMSN